MTPEEFRAGMVRLGLVIGASVVLVIAAGVGLWAYGGGELAQAIAATFALAGALLTLAGAVAGLATGRVGMDREPGKRTPRYRPKEERRQREVLAFGLIGAGVASFLVSLVLG